MLVEQTLEPLGQVDDLAAVLLRLELEPDELPCDLGAPRPQLVLVLPRELERLLEQCVRLGKLSEPDEHAADVRQRLRLVGTARARGAQPRWKRLSAAGRSPRRSARSPAEVSRTCARCSAAPPSRR